MRGKEREITLHIINFDLQFDQWKRKNSYMKGNIIVIGYFNFNEVT